MVQGYLDPAQSSSLQLTHLDNGRFSVCPKKNNAISETVRRCVRYLRKHRRLLGFSPIPFAAKKSLVGQSNHLLSSMPMSTTPLNDETDQWGRPLGFHHVYFVDGAVLPAIPAGPVTLTIMANAHRIGRECPL